MLLTCKCGAKNRLPPITKATAGTRARCGKCKHVFEIHELVRAIPEAPSRPAHDESEPDNDFDIDDLDLDTVTDEDLVDILLNGRGRVKGWQPFDNGMAEKLAPIRKELIEKVLPELRRKCFPKRQHASFGAAETQLHDILVNHMAKDASRIHSYMCPDCGAWHVGHSTERRV